jgi:hypothetical protein
MYPYAALQPTSRAYGGRWWLILGHLLAVLRMHKQVLFFRHSGPRLYPLTKSVGHQTSSMSCPTTYDAHKKQPLVQNEVVRLEFLRLDRP